MKFAALLIGTAAALAPAPQAGARLGPVFSEKNPVDVTTREAFSAWSVHANDEVQSTRAQAWYDAAKGAVQKKKDDKAAILESHRGFMSLLGRGADSASAAEDLGLSKVSKAEAKVEAKR